MGEELSEWTSQPTYVNDRRGSQTFKEGVLIAVTNYRTLRTEFSIGAGSLWRIIYCQDLIRPPSSVCSGVVGVEGQGIDTKLQQHLHQELLSGSSFFFFLGSVENRLEDSSLEG